MVRRTVSCRVAFLSCVATAALIIVAGEVLAQEGEVAAPATQPAKGAC